MENKKSYFHHNFCYMLRQLKTTAHFIAEDHERAPQKRTFHFDETHPMPNRTTLYKYQKEEHFTPKIGQLAAVVKFYNDNLNQNVTEQDFTDTPLDRKREDTALCLLEGDYYGLFLDPAAQPQDEGQQLRAAYLHIRNNGTEAMPMMSVHMAADIWDEALLFGGKLSELFQSSKPCGEAFRAFREGLHRDYRSGLCFFEGDLSLVGHMVTMELRGVTTEKSWSVKWEFGKILSLLQERERTGNRNKLHYLGSMAGALVSNDRDHGTYFTKFALLSAKGFRGQFSLREKEIVEHLRFPENLYGAFLIDQELDRRWYKKFLTNRVQEE